MGSILISLAGLIKCSHLIKILTRLMINNWLKIFGARSKRILTFSLIYSKNKRFKRKLDKPNRKTPKSNNRNIPKSNNSKKANRNPQLMRIKAMNK
jgi:hypothetical protein